MKKFYTAIVAIVAVAILMGIAACASAETYPQTFVVGDIDRGTDTMILVDYNENEWVYEGVEDYGVGDIVAAIMDDCGTTTIYDDEIVKIQYAGYMEGWE